MPKYSCLGEQLYSNGCTASGYVISFFTVLILVVAVPVLWENVLYPVEDSEFKPCLLANNMTEDDEAEMLQMYFRYEIHKKEECTAEETLFRGCKDDDSLAFKVTKYYQARQEDILKEDYKYIRDNFLSAKTDCVAPSDLLLPKFEAVKDAPFNISLASTYPFVSLLTPGGNVSYGEYFCASMMDKAMKQLMTQEGKNAKGVNLTKVAMDFVNHEFFVPQYCRLDCLEEHKCKITKICPEHMEERDKDLGYDFCDFVEFSQAEIKALS